MGEGVKISSNFSDYIVAFIVMTVMFIEVLIDADLLELKEVKATPPSPLLLPSPLSLFEPLWVD